MSCRNCVSLIEAVSRKHLTCLIHYRNEGETWDEWTIALAARRGSVDIVEYLKQNGCPWDEKVYETAAFHCRVDVLRYAYHNHCPRGSLNVAAEAAKAAKDSSLRYAKVVFGWDSRVYVEAIRHGRLENLKYAHNYGCPLLDVNVAAVAVEFEQMECFRYAIGVMNAPKVVSVCCEAAKLNRLDFLILAREKEYPWDSRVYVEAICYGRLENLKYAHTYGCPLDVNVAAVAVQFEQLECFRYAIDAMNAPRVVDVCFQAAKLNLLDFLILAREKEYPWDESVAFIAAKRGHYKMVVYLVENGCPYDYQKCLENGGKDQYGRSISEYLKPPTPPIPSVLEMSCSICFIGSKNIAYVPCGHVLSCAACAARFSKCPYCRTPLTADKLKLYFV